jgi:hypothetical protein
MPVEVVATDDEYLLGMVAKYLARDDDSARHDYGHLPGDPRGTILESWRFPWVEALYDAADSAPRWNAVTFVHAGQRGQPPAPVDLVGTFAELYDPIALAPVGDTHYRAVTLKLPKGQIYHYKFRSVGNWIIDPINPQRTTLDNGSVWSRFFTWGATARITLERWEARLLARIASHILPFHTAEGREFFEKIYDTASQQDKPPHGYRIDESVGAVNYVDKLLAREEAHNLVHYRICLEIIDQLLRQRNPVTEPTRLPREAYAELYNQMGSGNVPGWDYGRYTNPTFFLQVLRRHVFTAAFSHPRYGGNPMTLGWKYLEELFSDDGGATLFDWARAIEQPLGRNLEYRG